MKKTILFVIAFILVSSAAYSATCAVPNSFPAAATDVVILGTKMNENFDALVNCTNALDDDNIDGTPCIDDTKLCQIDTSAKVLDLAITGTAYWQYLTNFDGSVDNADALHSHNLVPNATSLAYIQENLYLGATHVVASNTTGIFSTTSLQGILEDHETRIDALEAVVGATGTTMKYITRTATGSATATVATNTVTNGLIITFQNELYMDNTCLGAQTCHVCQTVAINDVALHDCFDTGTGKFHPVSNEYIGFAFFEQDSGASQTVFMKYIFDATEGYATNTAYTIHAGPCVTGCDGGCGDTGRCSDVADRIIVEGF